MLQLHLMLWLEMVSTWNWDCKRFPVSIHFNALSRPFTLLLSCYTSISPSLGFCRSTALAFPYWSFFHKQTIHRGSVWWPTFPENSLRLNRSGRSTTRSLVLLWLAWLVGTNTPVAVFSDHANLCYSMKSQKLTPQQVQWASYISPFYFNIFHTPGRQNP